MKRQVGWLLAAACAALLGACDDDPDRDDWKPGPTPERTLPRDPERGPLEKAGRAIDHAVDEAEDPLRRGVERAGDAAEDAGDWLEEKTDIEGAHDAHDGDVTPPPR